MRADHDEIGADPGEPSPFRIAADRVKMRAELRRTQEAPRDKRENEQADHRERRDAERSVGDRLEFLGHRPCEIGEARGSIPCRKSPTPSVAISGLTCNPEISAPLITPTTAEIASTAATAGSIISAPLHDEGGEHRGDADEIGDRKVDRTGENGERLADCDEPQSYHALKQADDSVGCSIIVCPVQRATPT